MPYRFILALAISLSFVILGPGESKAWSEGYFLRGDGHGQYRAKRDSIAIGLGDAMHSNRAIHTIDPWPHYAKDDRLEFDGNRMNLAIERYKANESIDPVGLTTQNIQTKELSK